MKVKLKIFYLLFALFFAYVAFRLLMQIFVVGPEFTNMENKLALQDLDRVNNLMQNELMNISTTSKDWSVWDDTYIFLQDHNQSYLENNLTHKTLPDIKMDIFLMYDKNQKLYWADVVTPSHDKEDVIKSINNLLLTKHDALFFNSNAKENSFNIGIIESSYGPILFAVTPILKSGGNIEPCIGSMIMGRFLNDSYLKSLSNILKIQFHIYPFQNDNSIKFRLIADEIEKNPDKLYIDRSTNHETIYIYSYLDVIKGSDPLLLKVTVQRTIFLNADNIMKASLISLIIAGVFIIAILWLFLNAIITKPLSHLTNIILRISRTKDFSASVTSSKNDELGILTMEFGKMLSIVRETKHELESNLNLKDKFIHDLNEAQAIANVGSWEWDIANDKISSSDEACRIFELPLGQSLTHKEYLSRVHPEDRIAVTHGIDNSLVNKKNYNVEYRILLSDGKIRNIHAKGTLIFNKDSIPVKIAGTVQDITERKKNEERIQDLSNIIEQSLNEVYVFDAETLEFKFVNNAALTNIGFTLKEMIKMTPVDIKPELTMESFINLINPLLTGEKELLTFQTTHQRKDKTTYSVDVNLQLANFDGEKSFAAIIVDITERKKVEERMLQIMAAVDATSDAVGISDAQGHHIYQNKALLDLFGFNTTEEIESAGGGPSRIKDPAVAKEMFDNIMNGKSWKGELEMLKKDGTVFHALERADSIKNSKGEIIGLVGVITDITGRKQMEAEIVKSRDLALAGSLAKSEFIANMNHELRTPLNSILGFPQILLHEKHGTLNEYQKKKISNILTSGEHLLSLINGIIDLASIESGKLKLAITEFNLNSLVDQMKLMFKEKALNHSLNLEFKISADLPKVFEADGLKLSQITINFLSNAFKFTPDGGVILFEASLTPDNKMMISVTDSGPGISKELQKKLFTPFERLQSEKPGTGLGLALSKRIVELWNGQIGIVSPPEESETGCRFYFTIPLKTLK